MIFRLLYISFAFVLLLSTSINALRDRSLRQKRDVCPDTSVDMCLFVICENGGQCQQDLNTADCYKCMCPTGFTGKVCETPVAILPVGCNPGCQNGGVCSGNVCVCQAGYSGSLCEVRNYCLPTNPCQNGGQCISNTISYQCDCTGTGYTGTICTDIVPTDPCAPSPCGNGGQCSSNNGLATCLCINGYFGAYCQIAPVPCAAAPCENGGTCEEIAVNVYGCVCPANFTGIRCETYILTTHPCVTMPDSICLNGGTCTVNDADYLCKCAPGWNGRNCQTQAVISSCNPNPCAHGSCTEITVASEPIAYCTCDNQWTGKLCDIDMNGVCTAGYCLSGGTCQTTGNIPYCQCPALYTGPRCESYVGAITTTTTAIPGTTCFPNPCLNGGGCYINNNVVGCLCSSAWTGQICEIPVGVVTTTTLPPGVSACASNPCMNGGRCFNNGNGFVCACLPAWSGSTCTISTGFVTTTTLSPGVSACASNPCMNGGSCFNNGNGFVCACLPAWTGARCEYSQSIMVTTASVFNTCTTSQPCRNGGSCYTLNDSYYCQCTNAYTGTNCEAIIVASCPLNCAPGVCTISGSSTTPYVCMCNGTLQLTSCN